MKNQGEIMKTLLILSIFLMPAFASAAKVEVKRKPASSAFKVHPCEADAIAKADKLLRLHFADDSNAKDIENFGIDDKVTMKAPLKNPMGKGKFDVLEVMGFIYKGEYRMRFIYAQIKGTCALMGQEILEMSNPY